MNHVSSKHAAQMGVTLIELLVGITIGLLTIAVAMGALVASRNVTGTVNDATEIQQQASHAFRVIGEQIRQAGSIKLKMSAAKSVEDKNPSLPTEPVAFETDYSDGVNSFVLATNTLSGLESPSASEYKLTTGRRNYREPAYQTNNPADPWEYLQRNCLGAGETDVLIQSEFVLFVDPLDPNRRELRCRGNGGVPQPIIRNVANFQVRYLMQGAAVTGNPTLRYVDATTVGAPGTPGWSQVFAVEVCLVLYGNEVIDLPAGSSYVDCDGVTNINLVTLAAPRNRRMHMVFRNVYQMRSQGLADPTS
jgi:type IV pilus assembly protein PilW